MNNWKDKPNGTKESHWIDLIYQDGHEEDDNHWMAASVKWDGCIHLSTAGNVPFCKEYGDANGKRDEAACDDYIHICNIDDYIKKLLQLKDAAVKHFGDKWLEEYK